MAKFYQYRATESGGCERREIDGNRQPLGEWGKTECPPGYPPTSNQGTTHDAGNGTIILNAGSKKPIMAKKVEMTGSTDNDLIISSDQLPDGKSDCNCGGSGSSNSKKTDKTFNFTPMGMVLGALLLFGLGMGVYNLFFTKKPLKS